MQHNSHAVVIGGSLSGLLMSRVLANHFDRVTVIERDIYPDEPAPRKGVPHSRFPHTLMLRGQQILEQLFPGLKSELLDKGAIELDSIKDVAFLTPNGWAAQRDSELALLAFSRDLLDWSIRRRLAAFSQVQFLTGASVTELLTDPKRQKILGVSLHQHKKFNPESNPESNSELNSESNSESNQNLYADLVVDASGKASHTPQWLRKLGYEAPPETEINAFVGYVARIYQPPPDWDVNWKMVFMPTAPPQQIRGGAIFPIEGDRDNPNQCRWIVSLVGGDRDYPPTDDAGFLAFARSLPSPVLAEAIERATPLTPPYAYYGNENRQHYYEQSPLPARLVVVGHAACLLNPTYGQAMTVAALEAMTLDQFLRHQAIDKLDQQTHALQKQLAKAHQEAWTAAISIDYRYHSTQGKPINAATRFTNWYWDQLLELIVDRASIHHTFLEVLHLLKPSSVLLQPSIFGQILAHSFSKRWQRFTSPSESAISTR
ncbi:2-polyprenyl-6-methoxyphenol hydroxylase-like oxidoreductase [Leptolyngbya sp. FACHB-711]|uniref:NAD(P)/FAD-dependent oxidoreductase n=1 Tax=unclassified Leptolyngbya TaxID=2650499 RepID=UPI001686BF8B|nr:2-polyprenyl-6-methoxyphenol hydroxylase-like oxidoreductase [Leptolyngbya sp. FACHB-711]MBD1853833.1 2-polyprenyl-6-methoxyphenol hydroxylase-like oxidoreductase [Cyanobacteria bacterium FACHB-502]MBD2026180.1 2-polyprenyl-6-methoxyphenol hydroxylase-like oxidoreductase [Leptolyngbya sp. FACHB-711]